MKKQQEINEVLEAELNKQFPKGDKSRGKALVLFAIAQNEINKSYNKAIEDVTNEFVLWHDDFVFDDDGYTSVEKDDLNNFFKKLQRMKK